MKQAVMDNLLKFGIPKGSLEEATVELFRKAGWRITTASRSYFPSVDDEEMKCSLIRPQEMGRYVERGTIDVGIAGRDWVRESDSDVVEICEMVYSKVSRGTVRWVLVVKDDSRVRSLEDLRGGTISTELVGFTQRYFAERNIPVTVEFHGEPPRPRWSRGCATPSSRSPRRAPPFVPMGCASSAT